MKKFKIIWRKVNCYLINKMNEFICLFVFFLYTIPAGQLFLWGHTAPQRPPTASMALMVFNAFSNKKNIY